LSNDENGRAAVGPARYIATELPIKEA